MDLVTIACERDIQDLLLQAHSIDKFIEKPCRHWITVEDESLTPEEWHGFLLPYYQRHTLYLTFSKRPDLYYDTPFTLGYRRQQVLKLLAAANVYSDTCLVLDCKNFFIKPVDLGLWPYKNGNGRYTILEEEPADFFPRQWINHINSVTNLEIPKKFPTRLATPFACTKKYAKAAVEHPWFERLFFHEPCIPMTEMFYYYFFVPFDELDLPSHNVGGALSFLDNPNDIQKHIEDAKSQLTHGLHRRARKEMTQANKDIYANWLLTIGLNKTLVENYVYYEMTDTTWGT